MVSSQDYETGAVEHSVRSFYDDYGWVAGKDGKRGEDATYRVFRKPYADYLRNIQDRTAAQLPEPIGRLLIAGCGDMPQSHVALARRAAHVTCIDISARAVALAKRAIPDAETQTASILDMPFVDDSFDAVFCAHVLYHINAADQARAVRHLLRVTKPGGRVVVLYFNPASPLRAAGALVERASGLAARLVKRPAPGASAAPPLYFSAQPLGWWLQFNDAGSVSVLPSEIVSSKVERQIIRSDAVARLFYRAAAMLEGRAPGLAARVWMFPLVILQKR